MTTYNEKFSTNEQLWKLHKKLKDKNFQKIADAYWVEIWEHPSTDEQVVLERIA